MCTACFCCELTHQHLQQPQDISHALSIAETLGVLCKDDRARAEVSKPGYMRVIIPALVELARHCPPSDMEAVLNTLALLAQNQPQVCCCGRRIPWCMFACVSHVMCAPSLCHASRRSCSWCKRASSPASPAHGSSTAPRLGLLWAPSSARCPWGRAPSFWHSWMHGWRPNICWKS